MTVYRQREFSGLVQEALKSMPIVVITGLRQAGKTTFLKKDSAFKDRLYHTLDDFAQLEAAQRNPEGFLEKDQPVTIDEVQRCPDLLLVLKRMVDHKRRPGQFLLSGSANFSLLKGVAETLAGRALYLHCNPFTRREIRSETDTAPFITEFFKTPKTPKKLFPKLNFSEVWKGGMPSVCLGDVQDPQFWFRGYEQTYMERDLRQISQVADLLSFRNCMHLAALRTGQILKLSELGRDAKLNSATTSRYLGLLETSFLVRRLEPYLKNRTSRLVKSPKIYMTDSGLACHLAGVEKKHHEFFEPLFGAMLETYVAQNLTGILEAHWFKSRLAFWHVQGRFEVDFVIESGREVLAIEVKGAGRWNDSDLVGLKAFLQKTPHCKAALLAYNGTEAVSLGERLWAIPITMLIS